MVSPAKVPDVINRLTCNIFKEQERFVAICLELDVVASADTRGLAADRLRGLIIAQIMGEVALGGYQKRAPLSYWQRSREHGADTYQLDIVTRQVDTE